MEAYRYPPDKCFHVITFMAWNVLFSSYIGIQFSINDNDYEKFVEILTSNALKLFLMQKSH